MKPGKKNPIAPLPRGSSLLTLPQGSLATPQFVGSAPTTRGMMPKSWLNRTSDYDSNAIVADDFGGSNRIRTRYPAASCSESSQGWPCPAG